MTLLSRNEVCPRSSLSLALAGMTLDPLVELQSLKSLKPGAIVRLVEGSQLFIYLFFFSFSGVLFLQALSFTPVLLLVLSF